MYPERTNWGYILDNDNIDIASYPVWEGYEGVDPLPHGSALAITEPSEHKEIALEIIEYLLSDEIQTENARHGEPSIFKKPDINAAFGESIPELADKNLDSLFKNTPATEPVKQSPYDDDDVIWKAAVEFVDSDKDINDFIRVIQEEAEENVRTQIESDFFLR